MKTNKLLLIAVIGLLFWSVQSCQKSESGVANNQDTAVGLDAAIADIVGTDVNLTSTDDVHSVSMENYASSKDVISFGGLRTKWGMDGIGPMRFGIPHIDSCATVIVSSSSYPKEIIIDYGTGCTSSKGHVKKGKIIINISDSMLLAGATKTIVYQDFYIDSIKVEFSATVKNLGQNAQGHWVMESTWEQIITKNGDKSVQANTETKEWISGFETVDKSDDEFYKSGQGSITLNDTIMYSRVISKPLHYSSSCNFIMDGSIELTRNGETSVIDYGDGECDNKATITLNDTTEEINLHSMQFKHGGRFGEKCHGFGGRKGGK